MFTLIKNIIGHIVETIQRKRAEREAARRFKKFLTILCVGAVAICAVCVIGAHRKLLKAIGFGK